MVPCGTPERIVAQSDTFPPATIACFLPSNEELLAEDYDQLCQKPWKNPTVPTLSNYNASESRHTTECWTETRLERQHSKSILKKMTSAPTEFEDMVEIIEAISASLVSRKKKVPTLGFTLEL
ncbi:hypothetical protein Trydic_g8299 [Trypoxylus dichotomus]